jgi:hypothetical protein
MTKESLEALHEDLERYLEEPKEKKEDEFSLFPNIKETFDKIAAASEKFRASFGIKSKKKEGPPKFEFDKKLKRAKEGAKDDTWDLFDKFKKGKGMVRW